MLWKASKLPCLKSYDSQFNITPLNHEHTYALFAITNLLHHLLHPLKTNSTENQSRQVNIHQHLESLLFKHGRIVVYVGVYCKVSTNYQKIENPDNKKWDRKNRYFSELSSTKQPHIEQYNARDSCQTEKKIRHKNMPRNQTICTPTSHGCRSQ